MCPSAPALTRHPHRNAVYRATQLSVKRVRTRWQTPMWVLSVVLCWCSDASWGSFVSGGNSGYGEEWRFHLSAPHVHVSLHQHTQAALLETDPLVLTWDEVQSCVKMDSIGPQPNQILESTGLAVRAPEETTCIHGKEWKQSRQERKQ